MQYVGNRNIFNADKIDCEGVTRCLDEILENRQAVVEQICEKRAELCQKAMRNAYIAKQLIEETQNEIND